MSRTYFDSDGVIADFYGWIHDKSGIDNINELRKGALIDNVMFDNYESCFLDCNIIKGRESFIDRLIYDDDCYVLTSVPSFIRWKDVFEGRCTEEEIRHRIDVLRNNKIKWYKIFGVPEDKIIICEGTTAKMSWCKPGDILYDDFQSSVDKWNRLGGIGIWVESE